MNKCYLEQPTINTEQPYSLNSWVAVYRYTTHPVSSDVDVRRRADNGTVETPAVEDGAVTKVDGGTTKVNPY